MPEPTGEQTSPEHSRPDGLTSPEHPPPLATVVIAYFRNQATLAEQLAALSNQTDVPAFEVVIADNEGSAELP